MRAFAIALAFVLTAFHVVAQELGSVLWSLDMDAAAASQAKLPKGGEWVKEGPDGSLCFKVSVKEEDAPKNNVVSLPVDLSPWRGMKVALVAKAKAENVSKPPKNRWNGVKCMLHWRDDAGEHWANQRDSSGSFDWSELSSVIVFDASASSGELCLGLEESSGTVRIAGMKLVLLAMPFASSSASASGGLPAKTALRGFHALPLKAKDVPDLAAWGANICRCSLTRNWLKSGTDRDIAEYGRWIDSCVDAFEKEGLLERASKSGVKLAVCLGTPPGGWLPSGGMAMFSEREYQEAFVKTWERVARRLKGKPGVWAYDLLNEPVQDLSSPPGCLDWFELQVAAAKAVRAIDPDVKLILAPDMGGGAPGFKFMRPCEVPGVIYTVHMYWPLAYTHQGVFDRKDYMAGSVKPLAYPGVYGGRPFDKEALRRYLAPVREFQLACGVPIYVGEFSAVRWAPGADKYLEDCIALFEEYGWDWSYHAFREWDAWSVEHQDLPFEPVKLSAGWTDRAKVLLRAFKENGRQDDAIRGARP